MKIENWDISMSSSSKYLQSYRREESSRLWAGDSQPDSKKTQNPLVLLFQTDTLELSEQAKAMRMEEETKASALSATENAEYFEIRPEDRLKMQIIEQMMSSLTGKKFKFYILEKLKRSEVSAEKASIGSTLPSSGEPPRLGWGMEYHLHQSYQEKERLSFDAKGTILTSDGREINFSVHLSMSRDFAVQNHVHIRAGEAAVDPLVINFNGKAAALTQTKYSFDLDSDGKEDQISFVQPGSGFLALDLNHDGTINNGQELFGPSTGNGFSELAKHDLDGNQWIDENDSVYTSLRIWTKDSQGNDALLALGQAGVGAIYLGNIVSPFQLKDSNNHLLGEVRQTGIYVNENGSVGTIQQVDLAI